ncbi:MAG: YfhO family protein [Chloroflexia bacterium]|nr:YfhO family protein [Chloroflexia bacterium]
MGSIGLLYYCAFFNDILGSGSDFKGWNNYLEAPVFYIGLLVLLIFPQVFIHLKKRNKVVFGAFLAFWAMCLFFPFLRKAILVFTGDYYRYGFDFFIPFTMLFYALYALNEIDKSSKINYKLLGATLMLFLILLFFPYRSLQLSAIDNALRMKIVLFLFIYSGVIILLSIPRYKGYAQIALLAFIFVEVSYASYKSYQTREAISKAEFNVNKAGYADGTPEAVKYIKSIDKSLFFRTEKDYSSGIAEHTSLNDALAQGYYGTARYSSFSQLNYIRFLEETNIIEKGNEIATRWNQGLRGYPLLQTFGNIKYHFSKSEDPLFKKFGFDSIATVDSVKILKNRY